MRPITQRVLAPLALAAAGLVAGGCGGDDPVEAVAVVGDTAIPRAEFDRRIEAWERFQRQLDQPRGAQARKIMERQALTALIRSAWIRREAAARGIRVTEAEAKAWIRHTRELEQSLSDEQFHEGFVLRGGLEQARTALRLERIVGAETERVSAADIRRHYNRNKAQYGSPEARNVNIVVNKSKARIEQARRALADGATWYQVVRRYSDDNLPRGHRNLWVATLRGEFDHRLDEAVFRAERGELIGPLRTRSGWYLAAVALIQPARGPTFAQAKQTIRYDLASGRTGAAAQRVEDLLRKKYLAKTACTIDVQVPECGKRSPRAS